MKPWSPPELEPNFYPSSPPPAQPDFRPSNEQPRLTIATPPRHTGGSHSEDEQSSIALNEEFLRRQEFDGGNGEDF